MEDRSLEEAARPVQGVKLDQQGTLDLHGCQKTVDVLRAAQQVVARRHKDEGGPLFAVSRA